MKSRVSARWFQRALLLILAIASSTTIYAQQGTDTFVLSRETIGMTALSSGYTDIWQNQRVDDATMTNIPIGFSFEYYGQSYTQVSASSNGWISITNASTNSLSAYPFPNAVNPNGVAAPFRGDLLKDTNHHIRYQTLGSSPSRTFVIEYKVMQYPSGGNFEAQVRLNEGSNTIEFHFPSTGLDFQGRRVGTGIEDQNGTRGIDCNGGNTSSTPPTDNYLFGPPENTWTGAISSDWNTAANWSKLSIPHPDENVGFPSPTPSQLFSCTIPINAQCKDVRIGIGAELNGGSGSLTMQGSWRNEGGDYNPGTCVITYDSDEPQTIDCGGSTIGNVIIRNQQNTVTVNDEFPASNTGDVDIESGAGLRFAADANLSNVNLTNNGTIYLGITGTQVITTDAGVDLGLVQANNTDVADIIGFDGVVVMGDGTTFSGAGRAEFLEAIQCDTSADLSFTIGTVICQEITCGNLSFENIATGVNAFATVTCSSLTTSATAPGIPIAFFNNAVDCAGAVSVGGIGNTAFLGGLDCTRVTVDSEGITEFGGTTNCTSAGFNGIGTINLTGGMYSQGNIVIADDVVFNGGNTLSSDGTVRYESTQPAQFNGLEFDIAEFAGTAQVNIGGDVTGREMILTNGEEVVFISSSPNRVRLGSFGSQDGQLTINSSFDVTFNLRVDCFGDVSINGAGDFTFQDNLSFYGEFEDLSTGSTLVNAAMVAWGQVKQTVSIVNHDLLVNHFQARGAGGVQIEGTLHARGDTASPTTAALLVGPTSGLTIQGPSEIFLGQTGVGGVVSINGAFVMEAPILSPTQRAFLGRHSTALRGTMNVSGPNALVVFNGAILEGFGDSFDSYGITFGSDSEIRSFNSVSVTDALSTTAVIDLNTDKFPNVALDFEISSSSTSIKNIDANSVASRAPMRISPANGLGGNLFGFALELDDNDVLIWDVPSAQIEVTTKSLPNALVDNAYTVLIEAQGGNEPYEFSIANKPGWININPQSGVITGIPGLQDVGVHQFPVTVIDSSFPAKSASKIFTIAVDETTTIDLVMITTTVTPAKIGEPFGFQFAAAGGVPPYGWQVTTSSSLPKGVSLTPGGLLTGIPEEGSSGIYDMSLVLADSGNPVNTLSRTVKFTVRSASSDPEFVDFATGEKSSSCSISSGGKMSFWLWLVAGTLLLGASVVRRREELQS